MPTKWNELQDSLNTNFENVLLLKQAFTHASYRNEHRKSADEDNERLEFLGDAVLELVVSEFLFRTKPGIPEGELTRLRAAIVCEPSLVRFARRLGFDRFIRLGRGEERSGGRHRPALLADVFEAFIGALYLDQGFASVQRFVDDFVFPFLEDKASSIDFKTALQEWVQQNMDCDLKYQIVQEHGPAHAKEFVVDVLVGTEVMGQGCGRSKKEAEQQAAGAALANLTHSLPGGSVGVSKTD